MSPPACLRSGLRLGALATLALATTVPAPAQMPARVPTPNDTLVSTDVAPDRKVTFRIYAPKASEVGVRGDWMEASERSRSRRTSRGSGR